jgi:hypothetical protein
MTVIDTEKPVRRMAVPLINYTGKPIGSVTVAVDGLKRAKAVRSVERGDLKAELKDGVMSVTLPLDVADMLLIDL